LWHVRSSIIGAASSRDFPPAFWQKKRRRMAPPFD